MHSHQREEHRYGAKEHAATSSKRQPPPRYHHPHGLEDAWGPRNALPDRDAPEPASLEDDAWAAGWKSISGRWAGLRRNPTDGEHCAWYTDKVTHGLGGWVATRGGGGLGVEGKSRQRALWNSGSSLRESAAS